MIMIVSHQLKLKDLDIAIRSMRKQSRMVLYVGVFTLIFGKQPLV
jgi:hypothetical protein